MNGQLDQVLFPLLHGTLWYVGMDVLPPLAVFGADRPNDEEVSAARGEVQGRMARLWDVAPIPYFAQNGGAYDEDLVLVDSLHPDASGVGVHRAAPSDRW